MNCCKNSMFAAICFFYTLMGVQAQTGTKMATLVTIDKSRMSLAVKGSPIFTDKNYVFGELPAMLNGKYFTLASSEKGTNINTITPGLVYAITPLKGQPGSQEEVLVQQGFIRINAETIKLYDDQQEEAAVFSKQLTDLTAKRINYAGWVLFFFDFHSAPSVTTAAEVILNPDSSYRLATRLWQGCPTIERTGKDFWTAWFTGGTFEPDTGNYAVILRSKNGFDNFQDPVIVIKHLHPQVRVMDIQLWKDPAGRLWIYWTQNTGTTTQDGLWGTWAIVSSNPDAAKPNWTAPKRLCDGLTRNKPTVLSTGEWLLPSYTWVDRFSSVYVSKDKGTSWQLQGGPYNENVTYYENMVVEKKDKSVWMLQRSIKESTSFDKGKSWTKLKDLEGFTAASTRLFITKLKSGNLLMVYNNDTLKKVRKNMTVVLSEDDGKTWPHRLLLDDRSAVSYPDAIQDEKGRIFLVYDRNRRGDGEILMASFVESEVKAGKITERKSFSQRLISRLTKKKL